LLLTLTALIWGGNAVAGKFAVGHISPMLLTCSRWVGAIAILAVFAHRHIRTDWPVIRQHLPYLFIMGAVGFSIFNTLMYTALKYTTAINVAILQSGMPMFIFLLSFLALRIRPHWGQLVGYSLTLVGVLLTATSGDLMALAGLQINRGDLIMLVAAFVYSAYSVGLASKPDMHWLSFLTVLIASAAIAAIIMAAYEATTPDFIWPSTPRGWTVVFYTAIFPSIVAQGFFIRGVELLGGNRAGLFLNLVPIFGALLSVALLGESLHLYHIVALILVIGGILLAQRLNKI
jgi:drug/metabolite transporter (DMT)-like permease